MDKYRNFRELQAVEREGTDFSVFVQCRDGSRTAIVAPHGGAIEPGTSEIAQAVADDDMHLALFEGMKRRNNADLHLTSTNFDEPRCLAIIEQSDFVLTVHGEGSPGEAIFIGGADLHLRRNIEEALTKAGHIVRQHQNVRLQGTAPENICNRGRRKVGVQLELARGLRARMFSSLTTGRRKAKTSAFGNFVSALRDGLKRGGAG